MKLRINTLFAHITWPVRHKKVVSLTLRLSTLLRLITREKKSASARMRSAKSSYQRSSPSLNLLSQRVAPLQLPTHQRSMMEHAQSLLWLRKLLKKEDLSLLLVFLATMMLQLPQLISVLLPQRQCKESCRRNL